LLRSNIEEFTRWIRERQSETTMILPKNYSLLKEGKKPTSEKRKTKKKEHRDRTATPHPAATPGTASAPHLQQPYCVPQMDRDMWTIIKSLWLHTVSGYIKRDGCVARTF
jgi:hypothetical protein